MGLFLPPPTPDLIRREASRQLQRRDLGDKRRWWPGLSADAPTLTVTGPGGAPPAHDGAVRRYAHDAGVVTFIGGLPLAISALGSNYLQNQASGNTGSGAGAWAWEFDHYGADLDLPFRLAATDTVAFWVWVDGRPATDAPVQPSIDAPNSLYFLRLQWGGAALRRIRIHVSGADFGGVDIGHGEAIAPTVRPGYSIAVIGDSWVSGTGAATQWQALFGQLAIELGVELYACGAGGSGYTSAGLFAPFGDPVRIAPLAVIRPDEIWFCGSINDRTAGTTALVSAAKAAWAAARAASPNSILRIVGVQGVSSTPDAADLANNAALRTAALAAGVSVFDPLGEGWIEGTGRLGAPAGDGSADVLIGADGIHPTPAGHAYYARRLATALKALLNP